MASVLTNLLRLGKQVGSAVKERLPAKQPTPSFSESANRAFQQTKGTAGQTFLEPAPTREQLTTPQIQAQQRFEKGEQRKQAFRDITRQTPTDLSFAQIFEPRDALKVGSKELTDVKDLNYKKVSKRLDDLIKSSAKNLEQSESKLLFNDKLAKAGLSQADRLLYDRLKKREIELLGGMVVGNVGDTKGIGNKLKNIKPKELINEAKNAYNSFDNAFAQVLRSGDAAPPAVVRDIKSMVNPSNIQKIGTIEKNFKDPFRIFERIFKPEALGKVERSLLKPFAQAKGNYANRIRSAGDELKQFIDASNVKLARNSKLDKAIVDFGEGNVTREEMVKRFGEEKTKFAEDAVAWSRQKYDEALDSANRAIAQTNELLPPNKQMDPIQPREDYFRHGQELSLSTIAKELLSDTAAGAPTKTSRKIFNILDKKGVTTESIQKARGEQSKALSFITGYIDYADSLAYLENIKPVVPQFRQLARSLRDAALELGEEGIDDIPKLQDASDFIFDYADRLDGTWIDPAKRLIIENVPFGAKGLQAMRFMNNRAKANAVVGNAATSLAQAGNMPGMIVEAGQFSPAGAAATLKGITKGGDPASKSAFLSERYVDDVMASFDTKMIDKPKQLARWMISALDKATARFSVNAQFYKNKAAGMSDAEALYEADKATRKLIGGRGIGERSKAQSTLFGEIIAPFTLEATNAWYILGDAAQANPKGFAKVISILGLNHVFNKAMEEAGRSPVVFDPIDALIEGYTRASETEGIVDQAKSFVGPVAGETISNVPGGQLATQIALPDAEEREATFGTRDPARFSRYGSPIPGLEAAVDVGRAVTGDTDAARDLLETQALPFGGKQLGRVLDVGEGIAEGEIAPTPSNLIKGFLGGKYATAEMQEKYGQDDSAARLKLDQRLKQQDKIRDKVREKAEKEFLRLEKLTVDERRKEMETFDEDLKTAIRKVRDDDRSGLNYLDRQVKQLGVTNGERADFYFNELKDMTLSEREAYWRDQEAKGLLSKTVKSQIAELKGGKGFDEL